MARNLEFEYIGVRESRLQGGALDAIRIVVRGDDFIVCGADEQVDWLRMQIAARFDVKFRGALSLGNATGASNIQSLNYVLTWNPEGITYEAAQRHAEIISQELELNGISNGVYTPSISHQGIMFCALVARATRY